MSADNLLQCYNRGCGQKYKPEDNGEDSCCHHPGEPFFHDAYKGWTCCNRKCTDFTEFLNFKGCKISKHSNIKPPEPEKPQPQDIPDVVEIKPIVRTTMERPAFDTPMIAMKPEVAPSLKEQNLTIVEKIETETNVIALGTICKNGGCNVSYSGTESDCSVCIHHPGYPVFHEGLKFWSCCTKRTSDFNAFLNQAGCFEGKHLWIKKDDRQEIQCRWDHHQTATHVIVSIYAKQYCPDNSEIKLHPIRLFANVIFPLEGNAAFNLDVELRGIIDVNQSQVNMYGTKIEIKLRKAEPGSWSSLEMPREKAKKVVKSNVDEKLVSQVESVDLSDL